MKYAAVLPFQEANTAPSGVLYGKFCPANSSIVWHDPVKIILPLLTVPLLSYLQFHPYITLPNYIQYLIPGYFNHVVQAVSDKLLLIMPPIKSNSPV